MRNLNPLVLSVAVPIVCGIVSLLFSSDRLKSLAKILAFFVTLLSLAGSIFIFINKPMPWQMGSSIIFSVDSLSAFIAIGIAFFAFLITIYSFGFIESSFGRYFGYVLMTLGAALGVAYSNNLVALLVFWGMLASLLYLLVNIDQTDGAAAAAKKALIIIGATDALMLFGIGLIWAMTGTFSMDKIHLALGGKVSYIAYISLAIASFAKAGVIPFHSWLPDVAEDGPAPVTAYLPASLDKLLGIYLLARVSLNLFAMNSVSNLILLIVGSITIILAVIFALVQHDFKRLLGYHAVSQVGYMVLGIGTANPIGIAGGIFHMLNNAIYKSCLFLSGGNVEMKTGTTDLSKLGGLAKYMPITFSCFLIAALSISGIPPFNGFVSKWMIFQGIIELSNSNNGLWIVWLTAAMFGSALTIASFMKLLHAIFLGRPQRDFKNVKEVSFPMKLPILILASLCVIFGIFAFLLPIPIFIIPAIGMKLAYSGIWNPIIATVLIIIGIAAGFLIYATFKKVQFRTVKTFIGGEDVEKLDRISGIEFYNTIKDIKPLGILYKREEDRSLDIYDTGKKTIYLFTRFFQYLHNGILPTFLVWCLLGMVGIFFVIFFR